MSKKRLIAYETESGKVPFQEWMDSKRLDARARAAVDARLNRLLFGLEGDCRSVGEGVFELRIHLGAGYRVYYANWGLEVIILLAGGDKGSQAGMLSPRKGIGLISKGETKYESWQGL